MGRRRVGVCVQRKGREGGGVLGKEGGTGRRKEEEGARKNLNWRVETFHQVVRAINKSYRNQ